jgi:hypothetical protein
MGLVNICLVFINKFLIFIIRITDREKMIKAYAFAAALFFSAAPISAADAYFNGYQTSDGLEQQLTNTAKNYPQLFSFTSLAKTFGKHDVFQATLGSSGNSAPAIVIVAGLEGDDPAGTEVCLRFIEFVCRSYGTIDTITALLDRRTFYIFPSINPDAAAQVQQRLVYNRTLNGRPIDGDHDGEADEDGYEDLNGDGYITQMRVASPFGEWMADSLNPQLMRKADPAKKERGAYSLYTEGVDNDGDGCWNEDTEGGVDIGCNFPYNYRFFQEGAGDDAVSEVETRALADFFLAHPNIAAVFSFSSHDNLLHPWEAGKPLSDLEGKPVMAPLPEDAPYYQLISDNFRSMMNFKPLPAVQSEAGTFAEWVYYHFGRWSFSAPVWLPTAAPSDSSAGKAADDPLLSQRILYNWLSANGYQKRFVDWQAVDHPDFPGKQVEVGGFLPFTVKNPPADSLDAVAARYTNFFLYLARCMPTIEAAVQVDKLHDTLFRVTAWTSSSGMLPTNSRLGNNVQWVRKVKAELLLEKDQQLVSGPRFYLLDGIAPGRSLEKSWLIMAKSGSRVGVRASSPSVGVAESSVELK